MPYLSIDGDPGGVPMGGPKGGSGFVIYQVQFVTELSCGTGLDLGPLEAILVGTPGSCVIVVFSPC